MTFLFLCCVLWFLHFCFNFIILIFLHKPTFFFSWSLWIMLRLWFTFSKNQIFILLLFSIATFVSFSLIYALLFMVPFILLTSGFYFSSFCVCFMCKDRLLLWCSSSPLRHAYMLWISSLTLLVNETQRYELSWFYSHLFVFKFDFLSDFFLWAVSYSDVCYLASITLDF